MTAYAISPRLAVSIIFIAFGLVMGLWGGSVPEVAHAADIDAKAIGSAFLAYSIANTLAYGFGNKIGGGVSLKARLLILLALTAICVFALFHMRSAFSLTLGLFVFSFLSSSIDVVMNTEAVAVERDLGKPVLSGFHGLASLGVAGGAIAGSYLSAWLGLTLTAFVSVAAYASAFLAVLAGTPERGATRPAGASNWFRPELAIVALALALGASGAGETASIMFSANTLAEQAPALLAWSGIGATAYALSQAVVRLLGDRLRAAFGDLALIRSGLAVALVGFIIVSFAPGFAASILGFAIIGVGTACIFPCTIALATRLSHHTAAAVISMTLIIGGLIRIPTPLIYGYAAETLGFAGAYSVYSICIAAAVILTWLVFGTARRRAV